MCTGNAIQVELNGGLGNQLFQWASGANLASMHRKHLELQTFRLIHRRLEITPELVKKVWSNTSIKKSVFSTAPNYPGSKKIHDFKVKQKNYKKGFYEEKDFRFHEIQLINRNLYLRGYFQSWKYFEEHIPSIRRAISEFQSENPVYLKFLHELESEQWVAIHLRRGDYLNNQGTHVITSKSYYADAIKSLAASNQNLPKIIFTDSPEYVNQVIPKHDLVISVAEELTPMENLILMSKAEALIGANSTFSWWAGLAMDESKRKIFPSKWFTTATNLSDLLLPDWEQIANE